MELKVGRVLGIVILVVIIAIIVFAVWAILAYNDLVAQEEGIDSQWAQVTNEYQRKVDLIPQLAEIVEDYQDYEKGTLENVTALRTRWMEAKSTEEQVNVSEEFDQAMLELIVTLEAYPDIWALEAVQSLMVTLEGTENRITVERMRYNEDVRDYNADIRSFPRSIIAGWFDFEKRSYYESGQGPDQP